MIHLPMTGQSALLSLDDRRDVVPGERRDEDARGRAPARRSGANWLGALLIVIDALGACAAWEAVCATTRSGPWVARLIGAAPLAAAVTLVAAMANRAQKLYLARVCSVRSAEVTGLARTAAVSAVAAWWFSQRLHVSLPAAAAATGGVGAFVMTATLRGAYSKYVKTARASGRFSREVCVLGTNDEAHALVQLFHDQPELGYRVCGVVGDDHEWHGRGSDVPLVGSAAEAVQAVLRAGTPGVVIASTALADCSLDDVVRGLVDAGVHVQISTGLSRVGQKRFRPAPVSHHLLFYVERHQLAPWQSVAKRAMDIAVASVALALSAPVLGIAAVAIKLDDGGPVFFRQERVGRDGKLFRLIKLRTMVTDASSQMDVLASLNERNGPLFKLSLDPRVTKVGRVLRATSIDELPQLINVLQGAMSLVGPRPALPREVEKFDDALLERTSVAPGITGLWQVEARDNPSFGAYRRLDLFYVDNWSLTMDAAILAGTLPVVLGRAARALRRGAELVSRGHHTRETSARHALGGDQGTALPAPMHPVPTVVESVPGS